MKAELKKKNTAKNKIRRITKELEKNPNNIMAKQSLEKWRGV
jgi:hypothetical protein